ncbi:MAG: tRNA 2-thiouridine(34) synthase MnmA [Planctomycetota bacterium]
MATSKGKVLLAMSGGVDSSVAAALLLREGYDVVGVFMRLGSPGETFDQLAPYDTAGVSCDPTKIKIGHQGCCSINDAADARAVAAELDIPFYVANFKKDFGRIIDYFVGEYLDGRTPNPCVRCNDWLKFGKLHDYAKQIDADFVASGHYARVQNGRLLRGVDHGKDQSYVLFGVPRDRLGSMLLPIGGYEKPAVRELAHELGLPVFDKPDSQEICFVPDNDYAGLVERRSPDSAASGAILDTNGNEVGTHDGQHRFTVGQRRGVGVALGYPIYVVSKSPETNTVTVGSRDDLLSSSCAVGEANWLIDSPQTEWAPCFAQHRYNSQPARGAFRVVEAAAGETHSGRTGRFEVRFDEPQFAVAPGQALVLYDERQPDAVLGGGWIASAQRDGE